jgi:hypothetical protein
MLAPSSRGGCAKAGDVSANATSSPLNGHTAAAQTRSVINSRRFIDFRCAGNQAELNLPHQSMRTMLCVTAKTVVGCPLGSRLCENFSAGQLGARLIQTPRLARITSPMDGSPQSGALQRNHPMALRCLRVGAVHSIKRVGFVMSAACPVCPQQQTLPDPVGSSAFAAQWLSGTAPAWRSRPSHEMRVADNVCGHDRRQFVLLTGHGNYPRVSTGNGRQPRGAGQSFRAPRRPAPRMRHRSWPTVQPAGPLAWRL